MHISLQASALQDALMGMLQGTLAVIPKLVTAIVILLVGLILAKTVKKLVKKVLVTAKVDKLGDQLNEIDVISKANMKIEISTIASSILYYFIMLMVLILSTTALGMPEVTQLISDILIFLPNILVALIIMVLGTLLADAIKNMVLTTLKSLGVPSATMISNVLFYFLFINIILIALKQAKIETNFLEQNISILIAGVIAAFAIGYGLASKDTMSNMLASLGSKNLFKLGDKITIDGVTGSISNIEKGKVSIDTGSSIVVFPLSQATNQKVEFHK